jgi:hypothetical protein
LVTSEQANVVLPTPAEITAVAEATGLMGSQSLHWTVQAIDHQNIIDTTGGLYEVRGYPDPQCEVESWSCVVKVLQRSEGDECDPPGSWCYWRREAAFYASDLPASLPTSLRAPLPYAVTDKPDSCWVWMERVSDDTVGTWELDDYHRVAVAAGECAGANLTHHLPPSEPWLVQGFMRSGLADGGFWAGYMSRDSTESAWKVPLVEESFSRDAIERCERLWTRRESVLAVLDRLPQVFCHNDFHRRNVLLPKVRTAPPVVVDWAFAGPGAVAGDAACLTGGSLFFCDVAIERAHDLDETVFQGYLEGLSRAGWHGDARLIRLGFTAWIALWQAATLPGWVGIMLPEEESVNVEALFSTHASAVRDVWVELHEFALERADEADSLSRQLGLNGTA